MIEKARARIARARERARSHVASGPESVLASVVASSPEGGGPRALRVAIGDPQAPFDRFLEVVDRRGLLGDDGRLFPDVALVSMGDHFDWGGRKEREQASREALEIVAWLAAHPADQVTLILGNHDLSRVGELARFDDESFAEARVMADALYEPNASQTHDEGEFLARFPDLPNVEHAARDLATFRVEQRDWVVHLLRVRRFRLAYAPAPDFLLTHAGVTRDDLEAIGVAGDDQSDAERAAAAINARLDHAVERWNGRDPLSIEPLYRPGSAATGEGRGIVLQRPAKPPGDPELFVGPPRRRFDPRWLPIGLTQGVGHIRDNKCRDLLKGWAAAEPTRDGPLRSLVTDGRRVRYARGLPDQSAAGRAILLFLDGGMNFTDPGEYELLDLGTRRALESRARG